MHSTSKCICDSVHAIVIAVQVYMVVYCLQVPVENILLILMMLRVVSNNNDEYWCLYIHCNAVCNMSL